MKIGKAKFGSDFVKRKYWKLKDGESTFRILPPLGDLAESGKWSQFYNVHYGYKNSKGQMRVFQSPLVKNRKTKMVEVPDAALERIEKMQAQLKSAKDAGNHEVAKKISDLLQMYNLDNNHYVNAIDEQGNIGILKLRHRAKLALDATIKALRDSGIEPLDADSGRFFVFRRSGTGLETTFQVSVKKKRFKVEGVGEVEQDLVHVLSEEIISRLSREAAELDKLYKRPTSEEVARIVASSELLTGKSPVIDELFDTKADTAPTSNDDGAEEEYGEEEAAAPAAAAPAQKAAAPAATVTVGAPITTAAPAAAPVASAPQSLSTPPAAAPKAAAAPAPTDQSDEEFLKSLGL